MIVSSPDEEKIIMLQVLQGCAVVLLLFTIYLAMIPTIESILTWLCDETEIKDKANDDKS